MQIEGEWSLCDDGVVRPIVHVRVGAFCRSRFLIDTGADFTVLAATTLANLDLTQRELPSGAAVTGIGGSTQSVLVETILEFAGSNGTTIRFHCEIAALTDATATDISILGRDILDHFDVIVSRRNERIHLLFDRSHYEIHNG